MLGGGDEVGTTPARAAERPGGTLPAGLPEAHGRRGAGRSEPGRDPGGLHQAGHDGRPAEPRRAGGSERARERGRSGRPARPTRWPGRTLPVTWNLWQDPIAAGQPIEKGATLQIYNWADYINPAVMKKFAQQYDVKVKVTTFNNTDEALAKMRTGQLKFDVFFPTIDILGKLVTAQLIQPLQQAYIPHLATDVFDEYQNPFYDQKWRYTVPYVQWITGIAYRRDIISDDTVRALDNPWTLLWDPTYKGKIGIYDDYRESISLALMKNGITDLNTDQAVRPGHRPERPDRDDRRGQRPHPDQRRVHRHPEGHVRRAPRAGPATPSARTTTGRSSPWRTT